ncbi:hypothetical protein D3C76_1737980 [compost metagenome]
MINDQVVVDTALECRRFEVEPGEPHGFSECFVAGGRPRRTLHLHPDSCFLAGARRYSLDHQIVGVMTERPALKQQALN